ncbi:MAG: site-specific DNA-methyltransferase [Clostridia bacterium]|nr:site-specific DNA-methyltransferase [Clostridia bacterium]
MSTNISKQKREDLLAKIKEIRTFISAAPQDENTGNLLSYLSELEKDVNGKKYGLVFEEHREEIDKVLDTHTPVLTEDEELFIDNGGQMNFLIEGDNIASLKLLEKTHKGKIDLIYIDPPYNTGNQDFIYNDEYISSDDLFKHSQWLSFMEKRLRFAKSLLKSNGCIFMSIDNNEFAQLKLLSDKVFGDENFVTSIHVEMSATQGMKVKAAKQGNIVKNGEFILVYKMDGTKNVGKTLLIDPVKYDAHYNSFLVKEGICYSEISLSEAVSKDSSIINALQLLGFLDKKNRLPNKNIADAYDKCDAFRDWVNCNAESICRTHDTISIDEEQKRKMTINKVYNYSSDSRDYLICKNEKNEVYQRILLSEKLSVADDFYNTYGPTRIRGDWWAGFYLDMGNISKEGNVEFANGKKPKRLIKQIVKFASKSKSDIILDFFAGSGTTGHAIMELNSEDEGNRKFILCTSNENNICKDVTYKRLSGVINKEDYKASLKYYKIEYIPVSERMYYEYADELLHHIRELVELENGVNFTNNAEIAIVLTEEELDGFVANIEDFSRCKKLYMGHDLLPTEEQAEAMSLHEIEVNIIPDYYYRDLQEG